MRPYIVLDKERGITPLQALERFKETHPEYTKVAASYAGRLDPMASGKLLVLLGEECKKQTHYTKLDKEYEVDILLDISTDTGDTLGLAKISARKTFPTRAVIQKALQAENGSHIRTYPPYSSKTVDGTPLFLYALRGTLDTITIPKHIETVHRTTLVSLKRVTKDELKEIIEKSLAVVPRDSSPSKEEGADFRQDVVRTCFQELFSTLPERDFMVITVRATVGTGTYMRTLAERVGATLGTSALALRIHRTKIGRYLALGVWSRQF